MLPLQAFGDLAGAVNLVRLHGCPGSVGGAPRLRENPRLDQAARLLARGENGHAAMERAGYRAVSSAFVRMTHVSDDRAVEALVSRRFCSQALDKAMREIGTHRQGPDVWLVLAAPFLPPRPEAQAVVARRVLELTNLARSKPHRCGNVLYPAASPLVLAPALEAAALEHSRDMAAHGYLDHTGHDGSSPPDRVSRTGYRWRVVGENLASGVMTADEAVSGWLASPHHCENVMTAGFSQMAVAYAVNASSPGGIYWTQVFATPR
ncbi:MAG TPA: CAP domain-containing protein [Steroidobacteraceae bacterium]|nr:CAP domain-containing protein [Steroidobacteraceae bacterium]